jgi:hypothetical protein
MASPPREAGRAYGGEPDRMNAILTITPTPEARFERVSGAAGSMTTIETIERRLSGRGVSPAG